MAFDLGTIHTLRTISEILGLTLPVYHQELVEIQAVVVDNPTTMGMEIVSGANRITVKFEDEAEISFSNGDNVTVKGVLQDSGSRFVFIRPNSIDSVTII